MRFRSIGGSMARAAKGLVADEGDEVLIIASGGGGGDADPAPEPEPQPEPEPAPEPESAPEPAPAPEEAPPAAAADDVAAARAEERQRVTDVFASDASNGKERAAANLLANPKLSAEDIVDMLPQMKGGESDAMLASLASNPNPDLKPGSESGGNAADAKEGWNRTFARLGWDKPNT